MKNTILLGFLLLVSLAAQSQSVLYVDAGATGAADGSTWSDAFTSIDSAFAYYATGDSIWVKSGIYKPVGGTNSRFEPPNGVLMYGGFAGNETSIDQRIAGATSALDGDIGTNGSSTDNCRAVVYVTNNTSQIVLDGFKIRNGYAYTIGGSITVGGGGARIVSGNVKFENCEFSDNYTYMRGGALAIYGSSSNVALVNCVFKNNLSNTGTSSGLGGAIFCNDGTLKILGCEFTTNTARRGGAISTYAPNVTIDRTVFAGNKAANNLGGAIDNGSETSLSVYNSLFVGNYAETSGSAIYTSTTLNTEFQKFIGCTFANNYCNSSGTSYTVYTSDLTTVANCILYDNYAAKDLFNLPPAISPTIKNCVLEDTITGASNIYYSNPEFMNPGTTSSTPFALGSYDYTLKPNSSAINNGSNSNVNSSYNQDLEGNARIQSGTTDIGAYESDYIVYTVSAFISDSSAGINAGSGSYLEDSTATISTLSTNSCFEFQYWKEADSIFTYDTSFSIVVTQDRSFTAIYSQHQYDVTLASMPVGKGTLIGEGTYLCNDDSARTFVARPIDCYEFVSWTLNGNVVSTDTQYSVILSSDLDLVANFTYASYSITAASNTAAGGSISGAGNFECDSTVTMMATAANCYEFENWTENGNVVSLDSNYAFKAERNRSLVANFKKRTYEVSVKVEPAGAGTITGAGTYDCGTNVQMTATSNSGYAFASWEIDGIIKSSNSNYQFNLEEDVLLTARFKQSGSVTDQTNTGISIYPNPSSGIFTIQCDLTNSARTVSVFNSLGRLVQIMEENEFPLQLNLE